MNNVRYTLGLSLIGLGLILLIISLLGQWTQIGSYKNTPPRPWESFNEELLRQITNFDSLFNEAEKKTTKPFRELSPDDAMNLLYDIIIERFTHGEARHTIFTNWILWTFGKIYPGFGHNVIFARSRQFGEEIHTFLLG